MFVGPSGAPAGGFAIGGGTAGYFGLGVYGPGTTTIFRQSFTANTAGSSSNILAAGSPFGSSPLAFFGGPISATLNSGTVTVSPTPGGNPIPEPSTILLFGTGLAGLAAWRLRKQQVG